MISLFVIQSTSFCNLNCKYCYLPEEGRKVKNVISLDTLNKSSKLVLQSSLMPESLTILWHAGEPLSASISFYEKALKVIKDNNIHCKKLSYSIQTNATLINDKWCIFFKKYNFDVGVSIDGPEHIHNLNRIGWTGKPSFQKTMKGIKTLKKHGIKLSAICVINEVSLEYPDEIFNFFVENEFHSLAFNLEEIEGANSASNLLKTDDLPNNKLKYKKFFKRLLDLWILSDGAIVIREFNNFVSNALKRKDFSSYTPMLDVSQGLQCVTVRTDGKLVAFSPELATGIRDEPDKFVIGDVNSLDYLEDTFADKNFKHIREEINKGINKCKESCAYFGLCGGGWPSNKYAENGSFNSSETRSCSLHTKTVADILISEIMNRDELYIEQQTNLL